MNELVRIKMPQDFRTVSVFPSPADLLQKTDQIILRPNVVKGSYKDVEHYLDVQFRLMREDCVRPLREAIAFYGNGIRTNPRLFTDVRIRRTRILGRDRIVHEVTFNPKKREDYDWEDGRLLKSGSLLCLSRDNFQRTLFLGVVVDGRPERLRKGKLLVDFERTNVSSSDLYVYVMLESDAYFESYRHNLEALQERNSRNFPLREYIVDVRNKVKPPLYLTALTRYNFNPLLVKEGSSKMPCFILNPLTWPSADDLDMDPSQLIALKTAMTHELAIIQGPPGTGKTFVGLNIVKLLLHNNAPRPILIVCYTNHALDQFLEGVLKLTDNVVRLGGRCRSDTVKDKVVRPHQRSLIQNASVIGMTTTGAAKQRNLLLQVRPKIVMMEEAAEVLEAHALTALNEYTQHFIMIGDHLQLRPRPSVHELDRDYKLGVSLFERMVCNGLPYCTLGVQHRMRPCISRLLVPHIYQTLKDHPDVSSYENVQGMDVDMFFISHQMKETKDGATPSRANEHEALFLIELCRYLMLQGYGPEQVTILATYNAQVRILEKLQKEDSVIKDVRITTVDNYQGEENDVILLSLVRSNAEGSIGFLKTANRVCVALSRAREGLYCIGNFQLFQEHSVLWQKIVCELTNQNAIGPSLRLKCKPHGRVEEVTVASDFHLLPGGGCSQRCGTKLNCGHTCQLACHTEDRDHLEKAKNYCGNLCKFDDKLENTLGKMLQELLVIKFFERLKLN